MSTTTTGAATTTTSTGATTGSTGAMTSSTGAVTLSTGADDQEQSASTAKFDALVELRNLLLAAGYDRADKATDTEAQNDARNYLQLLLARQTQLQIEHQHVMAVMGPLLSSTMVSVSAMQRTQQLQLAAEQQAQQQQSLEASGAESSNGRRARASKRRETLLALPDRAPLSYSKWFETSAVAMALASSDGALATSNAKLRLRRRHESIGTRAWRDGLALIRLSEATSLYSELPEPQPQPLRLPRPAKRLSGVVRVPVEEEDDDDGPEPPPARKRAAKPPASRKDVSIDGANDTRTRPVAPAAKRSREPKQQHVPADDAEPTTTRCGRAVKSRR